MLRSWLLALATVALTACQGELPSFSWPRSAPPVATPTPITISVLGPAGSAPENQHIQSRITAFEQAAPGIRVSGSLTPDYTGALEDAFAAATSPDLFVVWSHELADLAADEAILPVPSAYDRAASLPEELRPAIQVDGTTYCLPRDATTLALFYNPSLFDRVEAAYPTPQWTWADLQAAAQATTDANNGIYGLVLTADTSRLSAWLAADDQGGDPWTGADAIATTHAYVNMFLEGSAVEPPVLDSAWPGEAFGRGRAAMTLEASWVVPFLAAEFPELKYSVLELPIGSVRRSTVLFASCWAVNSRAANPQAAFQLADFLTSPDSNAAWATASGLLPPSPEQARAWLTTHPAYAPFITGLDYALPWAGSTGFAAKMDSANNLLSAATQGDATAEDVIERIAGSVLPSISTPTPAPNDTSPED